MGKAVLHRTQAFHLADGTEVERDFLRGNLKASYARHAGYTLACLPLKGNLEMIVALPDEGVDLASLLSIQDLMPSLPSASGGILQKLHVELPAFSFSTSLDLVETLEAIGIRDAFSATADFSGLTDAPVFLTGARQDARITVDENGIEAAAFTELFGEAMAAPGQKEPDPIPFIVNRPFLFCVATEGIPLFVGVVLDPGA